MDKNLVLAIVLSTLFMGVWYKFFAPKPQSAPVAVEQTAQTAATPSNSAEIKANDGKSAAQAPVTERVIETEFEKIVIDSRGAGIKHWWVKEKSHLGAIKPEKDWPDLVNHAHYGEEGLGAEDWGFSTFAGTSFKQAPVTNQTESLWLATLPSGLQMEKKFTVQPVPVEPEKIATARILKLSVTFKNPSKKPIPLDSFHLGWGPGLGTVASEQKENIRVTRVLAYPSPTKEVEKFKKDDTVPYNYSWAAVDNRYYLLSMLPKQGQFAQMQIEKSKENPGVVILASAPGEVGPQNMKSWELDIYGGPKGYTQLKKMGLGLEQAVDFGTFGFLGKWALKALYLLRRTTGNYGWSIILLTIALQTLVLPLTVKSYQSTLAMKKIQPKVQEVQKRYKDDAMRMNQEMMKLYKESGTNPFGGCLPMVLQIPVFWAFFTMLRNSYELHGAPWMGWIQDLSMKDPYYVLPLVMGGGMFLQQKLTGPVGDPTQAKMMMFMPIIFTFMFLNFPSGLVLYWLTNSLVGISVQSYLSRRNNPRPALQKTL